MKPLEKEVNNMRNEMIAIFLIVITLNITPAATVNLQTPQQSESTLFNDESKDEQLKEINKNTQLKNEIMNKIVKTGVNEKNSPSNKSQKVEYTNKQDNSHFSNSYSNKSQKDEYDLEKIQNDASNLYPEIKEKVDNCSSQISKKLEVKTSIKEEYQNSLNAKNNIEEEMNNFVSKDENSDVEYEQLEVKYREASYDVDSLLNELNKLEKSISILESKKSYYESYLNTLSNLKNIKKDNAKETITQYNEYVNSLKLSNAKLSQDIEEFNNKTNTTDPDELYFPALIEIQKKIPSAKLAYKNYKELQNGDICLLKNEGNENSYSYIQYQEIITDSEGNEILIYIDYNGETKEMALSEFFAKFSGKIIDYDRESIDSNVIIITLNPTATYESPYTMTRIMDVGLISTTALTNVISLTSSVIGNVFNIKGHILLTNLMGFADDWPGIMSNLGTLYDNFKTVNDLFMAKNAYFSESYDFFLELIREDYGVNAMYDFIQLPYGEHVNCITAFTQALFNGGRNSEEIIITGSGTGNLLIDASYELKDLAVELQNLRTVNFLEELAYEEAYDAAEIFAAEADALCSAVLESVTISEILGVVSTVVQVINIVTTVVTVAIIATQIIFGALDYWREYYNKPQLRPQISYSSSNIAI